MTPLRQRITKDMQLRGLAPHTPESLITFGGSLARTFCLCSQVCAVRDQTVAHLLSGLFASCAKRISAFVCSPTQKSHAPLAHHPKTWPLATPVEGCPFAMLAPAGYRSGTAARSAVLRNTTPCSRQCPLPAQPAS
jgi:hypothetical protein